MKAAEILRRVADMIDAAEPEKAPAQQPIVINVNGAQAQQVAPEQDPEELETDTMVPPLQQKLELLKKNAGLANVYDQEADEDEPLDQ
jgi:hypothetical protein